MKNNERRVQLFCQGLNKYKDMSLIVLKQMCPDLDVDKLPTPSYPSSPGGYPDTSDHPSYPGYYTTGYPSYPGYYTTSYPSYPGYYTTAYPPTSDYDSETSTGYPSTTGYPYSDYYPSTTDYPYTDYPSTADYDYATSEYDWDTTDYDWETTTYYPTA